MSRRHRFGRFRVAQRRRTRRLPLATVRRRSLAALINSVVGIAAVALAIVAGVVVGGRVLGRRASHLGGRSPDGGDARALSARLSSKSAQLALHLVGFATAAVATGHRSPGFRLLGLRRVDARTGREVTRRQELTASAALQVWRILVNRLLPAGAIDDSLDHEKLRSEMAAARRMHAHDRQAEHAEIMRIYGENKLNSRASCLRVLPRVLLGAAVNVPMWSSLRQSLPDRIAGTVVIVDRGSRPLWRRRRSRLRELPVIALLKTGAEE